MYKTQPHRANRALSAAALLAVGLTLASGGGAAAQSETVAVGADAAKNVTLLGIPSATVAPGGLAFGVLSLTSDRLDPNNRGLDGSMAFGFGVGDARDGVGLQFAAHITSLTDDFADSGYLEVKASRQIAGGDAPTFIGLSVDGAGWGDASGRDTTGSVALTSFRNVRFSDSGPDYPVMFTLGVGSHERNGGRDPGLFAGVGIGLTPGLGVSAAWAGDAVNLGASFRFESVDNLGVNATLFDAFDQQNSRRLSVSITYFLTDLF